MSKLYCMCKITGSVPDASITPGGWGPIDGQCFMAPNRFGVIDSEKGIERRPVLLRSSMENVHMGATQVVPNDGQVPPNGWPKTKEEAEKDLEKIKNVRVHYPNVDIYRCRNCGAMVVHEG